MANSPQTRKRARQNDKRRAESASKKSLMRTHIKNIEKACANQSLDKEGLKKALSSAQSNLDKAAKKIIHPNKASRLKSRLAKLIKQTV